MTDEDSAGLSARREYERRKAKDEARLREGWGRFGGLAVALSAERQSTRAWATGAAGEQRVGRVLDTLRSDTRVVLHDRRIPGSRANIDHLVVTTTGVWVIDAKQYKGRVERRVEGGFFRPSVELLYVNGRNKTALVQGVHSQVKRVQDVLGDVPVTGALCFVGADWGLFGKPFTVDGVEVLWPGTLESSLRRLTPGSVEVGDVAAALLNEFHAA